MMTTMMMMRRRGQFGWHLFNVISLGIWQQTEYSFESKPLELHLHMGEEVRYSGEENEQNYVNIQKGTLTYCTLQLTHVGQNLQLMTVLYKKDLQTERKEIWVQPVIRLETWKEGQREDTNTNYTRRRKKLKIMHSRLKEDQGSKLTAKTEENFRAKITNIMQYQRNSEKNELRDSARIPSSEAS